MKTKVQTSCTPQSSLQSQTAASPRLFPFAQVFLAHRPGQLLLKVELSLALRSPPVPCPMLQPLFTLKENCLFCSQSSAEQKDLSDSGEEPQGEAEAPHHGTGHPESAGEHALEPPAPASASASAPEAQLPPFPQELAGVSPPPPSIPGRESQPRPAPFPLGPSDPDPRS